MHDIYFTREYGKLNELIEDGKSEEYIFKNEYGVIRSLYIKREIPEEIEGQRYYDLVSPYGYGGPVIEECEANHKESLIDEFGKAFREYCLDNRIVSEFVRFHPIVGNGVDFQKMYHAQWNRHTVGTDLTCSENPIEIEFSKSCRKRIRKAVRKGISYKITENPQNVEIFKEIYYPTMDRNKASGYYYFSDEYFEKCLEYFREKMLLIEAVYEGKTIAAGLYFLWEKTIHIHLTGTLSEYMSLCPEYILRYAVTLWGIENGYDLIHNGGGRTADPEDSLYQFKKQFGQVTSFDFYIGKKIWDQEIYDKLCMETRQDDRNGYFPAYRNKVI